jgi:uncharacterized protein (TIGR02266 family)
MHEYLQIDTEVLMTTPQEGPEKRNNPKVQARIAIFHGPYQKTILTDYSMNMSTGGVFIESKMILPEDTELTVKFKLPDTDTIIVAKARVAWQNAPPVLKKPSLPHGMGLQFLDLSLDDLHNIRAFLESGTFEPTW